MALFPMLAFVSLWIQLVPCVLLAAPMPTNSVRGAILHVFEMAWRSQHVRYTAQGIATLNFVLFLDAMRAIQYYTPDRTDQTNIYHDLMQRTKLLTNQRNAYIAAFNLLLSLLLYRLVTLSRQLYTSREQEKVVGHIVEQRNRRKKQ